MPPRKGAGGVALAQQRSPSFGTVACYVAGVTRGREQVGERAPDLFLSLRHIPLLPAKANTHLRGPDTALAEYSGEQQHQHLVTIPTGRWQLARNRSVLAPPRHRMGWELSPVYDMPYSRLKPRVLVLCPTCHLNLLAGRELPVRESVTTITRSLTLPSRDCCLCAKREKHTETGRLGRLWVTCADKPLSKAAACGER